MAERRFLSLCVLGAPQTGKKSLLLADIKSRQDPHLQHRQAYTLEDLEDELTPDGAELQRSVDDEAYVLQLTVSNADESYKRVLDERLRRADGFILVFAVDSRSSFQQLRQYVRMVEEARQQKARQLALVVVGNKRDAAFEKREVQSAEAQQLCEECGIECYVETSAERHDNVTEVLEEAVRAVLRKQEQRSKGCIVC